MNRRRVTSRTMDPKVVELSGMTQHELETLANAGVTNTDNLSVLEEADIIQLLPNSSILLRRKLARLGTFLERGHVVNVQTTMQNVMVTLSMPMATTAQAVVPAVPAMPVDPTRGAPKIYCMLMHSRIFPGIQSTGRNGTFVQVQHLGRRHMQHF